MISIKKYFYLIQQAASLMLMPRAHIRSLWTSYDTISSHSHHVSIIAYLLCKMEWWTDEDAQKCCTMAVFHDLPEARTGDHDFIAKNYNESDEEKAVHDQFSEIPWLMKLMQEYNKRESFHARIAKDADSVAQLYIERVLMRQWNNIAKRRYEWDQKRRVPYFNTQSAKRLADQMHDSSPNRRYFEEFVEKDFNQENLTGKMNNDK